MQDRRIGYAVVVGEQKTCAAPEVQLAAVTCGSSGERRRIQISNTRGRVVATRPCKITRADLPPSVRRSQA
jgi:hypothetical protein